MNTNEINKQEIDKQIEKKIKEMVNKGLTKGNFRIYVDETNANWYLIENKVLYLTIKFKKEGLGYDTIIEETVLGCEGNNIFGGYYFIGSITL